MPGCFVDASAHVDRRLRHAEEADSGMPATRASLTRRTSHDAVDLAKGWTLKTTELPAAIMPENLLSGVAEPTIETAQALMKHPGIQLLRSRAVRRSSTRPC